MTYRLAGGWWILHLPHTVAAKILPCFYPETHLLFIALFSMFHSKYLNQSLLRDANNYTGWMPCYLFIFSLLDDLIQRPVNGWSWIMNSEQCGEKRSWPKLRCNPGIMVGAFRKTTEYLHRRFQANIQMEKFPDIKALPLVAVFGAILIKRGFKLVKPSLCSLMIKHWTTLTSTGRRK